MHALAVLLIVTVAPDGSTDPSPSALPAARGAAEASRPGAAAAGLVGGVEPWAPLDVPGTEVFACTFDGAWDEDFDGWPDGWTRHRGPGYPKYVSVRITGEETPADEHCLRIDLDGGGAIALSPPVRVGPQFDYAVQGWVRTRGLTHDHACLSLTFLDQARRPLETFRSDPVGRSQPWKRLRLGPVTPSHPETTYAVIGLHLEPGRLADLTGTALFDEIRLGRLPQMTLALAEGGPLRTDPSSILVRCRASGLTGPEGDVEFALEDAFGRPLARVRKPLTAQDAPIRPTASASPGRHSQDRPETSRRPTAAPAEAASSELPPARQGTAEWKPPVPGPGFYRVRALLDAPGPAVRPRERTLVVLGPGRAPEGSQFGWTLAPSACRRPLPALGQLLSQAAVRWVRYPVALGSANPGEIERFRKFADAARALGIEPIGMVTPPPLPPQDEIADLGPRLIAGYFSAPQTTWDSSLDALLGPLAPAVPTWQLGLDTDTSFVALPDLPEMIAEIRQAMERAGGRCSIGFAWDPQAAAPPTAADDVPWDFLTFPVAPDFAADAMGNLLQTHRGSPYQRWVVIRPRDRQDADLAARINDLVGRMVAATAHGADRVFAADPLDAQHGLCRVDGSPGELFLPWRTTASLLGGTRYLGTIRLPAGSRNHLFARGRDAVMVVQNEVPAREALYLGPDPRQVNVWGRSGELDREADRHVVPVGPLPTFLTGVDARIVRWRQAFRLAKTELPSVVRTPHPNRWSWSNPSDQPVEGQLELVGPEGWQFEPGRVAFQLAPGESLEQPFSLTLPNDANNGAHPLRADFRLSGSEPIRFSAFRQIQIGGPVRLEAVARLNGRGDLEVEQYLVNQSPQPVSFQCYLLVPHRRHLSSQVIGLGQGRDVQRYRLPRGTELAGQTLWLRAEEIGGPRVLNCHLVVEATP